MVWPRLREFLHNTNWPAGLLTCLFVLGALHALQISHERDRLRKSAWRASAIIGRNPHFEGNLHAPYTLVEFGDYQCPPCRALSSQIPAVIQAHSKALKFEFRNFPLTAIHPAALPAATMAEVAGVQGKFWGMHDALYAGPRLRPSDIPRISRSVGIDPSLVSPLMVASANARIDDDLREAHALGLAGTPSLLLSYPSGHTERIGSLDQLDKILDGAADAARRSPP